MSPKDGQTWLYFGFMVHWPLCFLVFLSWHSLRKLLPHHVLSFEGHVYIKENASHMFRIHLHLTHWPLFSRKCAWCPNYSINPFWIISKPLFYWHKNLTFDLKGNGIWTGKFSFGFEIELLRLMWESEREREKAHLLYFSTCLGLMGNFMQGSPAKTQINDQVSIYFIGRMLSCSWVVSEAANGLWEGTLQPTTL